MANHLPEHKTSHLLGTHSKRVGNRAAMNAILFFYGVGCQWNDLNTKDICSTGAMLRFLSGSGKMVDRMPADSWMSSIGHGC
ncbi:hypothetical protein J1780_03525 [Rahnella aceris]|nr:hypothetical protein [Rahnella aceris]